MPVAVLQGGEVAETAVEGLDEEELARGRARRRPLDPARAGAGAARRQPDAPRRPPRRARPPRADRPPRAPPLGRHVRADRGADRRRRAGPGDRRLLPARANGRRHGGARRGRPDPRARAATPTPRTAAGRCTLRDGLRAARARSSRSRPHLEWMRDEAPRAIVDGRARARRARPSAFESADAARPRSRVRAGAARPCGARSSTTEREPLPRPWRRKLAAPAAAPMRSVSSQSRPAAMQAARPPIIESPQPSREPRSKRGGTSSQASSPRSTIAGSSARVMITAPAPASSSRSRRRAHPLRRVDRARRCSWPAPSR